MAWRCSGKSNANLVENLMHGGLITSSVVKQTMLTVDRAWFVPSNLMHQAYKDQPLPLGHDVTISAPHMHADMLERLEPYIEPGFHALDVGSGSGYLASCMISMMYLKAKELEESGQIDAIEKFNRDTKVIGIEYVEPIYRQSLENIKKNAQLKDWMERGLLTIRHGNGWKGDEANAPFNAIHVGAAATHIPQSLVDQLANGGRMVIPVGKHGIFHSQKLMVVDKDRKGSVEERTVNYVAFVPLVNPEND
ncbi:hypothetical protein ABK040_004878 [Willaertia magna]